MITHLESIHNYRVIPSFVISPMLISNFLIQSANWITSFNIRLLLDTVQIFMQPVQ